MAMHCRAFAQPSWLTIRTCTGHGTASSTSGRSLPSRSRPISTSPLRRSRLDAWFTHRASAALFRGHQKRISLLIHGNDHGRNELAVPRTVHDSAALLDQAMDRIEGLERKANLQISRVMVPPHGACGESMLAQLPLHGFESACISADSLRTHNADRPWTRALGFAPSETVAGCTVLPRWSLTRSGPDVLLAAAYLGQPLILRRITKTSRTVSTPSPLRPGSSTRSQRLLVRHDDD